MVYVFKSWDLFVVAWRNGAKPYFNSSVTRECQGKLKNDKLC